MAAIGRNVFIQLFKVPDLQDLAEAAGLVLVPREITLSDAVELLDEAFSDYVNAAAMLAEDSPAAHSRDWCAGLSTACADLLLSLGYDTETGEMCDGAWRAESLLKHGWSTGPRTPEGNELRERLRQLLTSAVPDTYISTERRQGQPHLEECWLQLIGRLGFGLAAVAAVAASAERALSARAAPGGSRKDFARRYLVQLLVEAFLQLFGRLPEAAPGSSGFRWLYAVMELAGRRASEQRNRPAAVPTEQAPTHTAALEAIEAVARHVAPPPYTLGSRGEAKLDHWIREALHARRARRRAAPPEP
jgi:hypothetical protein